MCFPKPKLAVTPNPEATPAPPETNGPDQSGSGIFKSKKQGVGSLTIPLNVPSTGTGLTIPAA